MNSVDDEDNFPFITAEAHPSAHVNLADNDEDNFPFITAAADVKAIKVKEIFFDNFYDDE